MGNIFQSYEWSIQREAKGWRGDLLTLEENGDILGGAMLYWKNIPFFHKPVFRILYGPVWNNKSDVFNIMCDEIITIGRRKSAIGLEFQIHLPEYINGKVVEEYAYVKGCLADKGFERLPKRSGTYWVNLEKDEKDIFRNLSKNHRRDIRTGLRENVQIKVADDVSMVDTFYKYYSDLFRRKQLIPLPRKFFDKGLKNLCENNKCKLFYAEYDGVIYNMAVISLFGNPMYVWGASIRSEGKPPMGQLLHWEIIKWLKEKNYKIYDLGGSPGAFPQKEHPNYSVWRFKKGFNGDYVEFLSHHVCIFNKRLYGLYERVLPIYRKYFYPKQTAPLGPENGYSPRQAGFSPGQDEEVKTPN